MQSDSKADRPRAIASRAHATAALLLWLWLSAPASALAHDVADELTVGSIRTQGSDPTAATPQHPTRYVSDRISGSIDASDAWSFGLSAGVTHYGPAKGLLPDVSTKPVAVTSALTIFEFGGSASFMPDDHFAFDASAFGSPASTSTGREELTLQVGQVETTRVGTVRNTTSSFGFSLGGEYSTAGDGDAESTFGLLGGLTSYSTTQAVRIRTAAAVAAATGKKTRRLGKPETAALLQYRATATFIETLFENTDLGVDGTYYFYSRDPSGSGYYGSAVFGRVALGDGIPLEPLRFAVRPSITERIGRLRASAYFQYGGYVEDGSSVLGGVKLQYKAAKDFRVWVSGNLQHDQLLDAGGVTLVWGSVGARLLF